LLVAGASDQYRFELHSPARRVRIVERVFEPVPLIDAEREFARTMMAAAKFGSNGRTVDIEWDGRIPTHHPAYDYLVPTHSGELWIFRQDEVSQPIPDCDSSAMRDVRDGLKMAERCYTGNRVIDVFDLDGRYLGGVELTGGRQLHPGYTFIRGPLVLTVREDEAGTVLVERYRLVPPGKE
jgi:hypothetical protein